jgi:hypothetical protein
MLYGPDASRERHQRYPRPPCRLLLADGEIDADSGVWNTLGGPYVADVTRCTAPGV